MTDRLKIAKVGPAMSRYEIEIPGIVEPWIVYVSEEYEEAFVNDLKEIVRCSGPSKVFYNLFCKGWLSIDTPWPIDVFMFEVKADRIGRDDDEFED